MFPRVQAALLPLWAVAGLLLTPAQTQAQTQSAATPAASAASAVKVSRADPSDPKAPVPAALYTSPLRAYQTYAEPPVAPWRDTNEVVRQRGGWRSYAREAPEPDTRSTR